MSAHARLMLAVLTFAAGMAAVHAADAPREVHGVADAYGEEGVALAWAVLRGDTEAATQVVIRIAADPGRYARVAAVATNPFSQRQQQLLRAVPIDGVVDIRVPRAQFADFPRSEIRFYGAATPAAAEAPALIVFYLGVPDTTPEFKSEAMMDAYLVDRLARFGKSAGSKAP